MAKAKLIDPIKSLHGSLASDHRYYLRTFHGKTIIQRKPDRSNHIATEAEKKNRERFKQIYVKKSNNTPTSSKNFSERLELASDKVLRLGTVSIPM